MNLLNNYWSFQSAIPPRICDDIIKYGLEQQEQRALTGDFNEKKDLNKKDVKKLHKKRKSNVVWMNDKWIYKEIHPYINTANRNANWNFEWDWSESCQFTKYKLNQFYDWHCDSNEKPYDKPSEPNSHGKIRKLSTTVSLVDSSEYEGGDFVFIEGKEIKRSSELKKGCGVFHSGDVIHSIEPVTKGTRWSLVSFFFAEDGQGNEWCTDENKVIF